MLRRILSLSLPSMGSFGSKVHLFQPKKDFLAVAVPMIITRSMAAYRKSRFVPASETFFPKKPKVTKQPGVSNKRAKKRAKHRAQKISEVKKREEEEGDDEMSPEDFVKTLDLTLTPEQREHVEKIKKKVSGGFRSPRSAYREVPREDEMEGDGLLVAELAPDAQKLIDYAYSFIPKRDGPRRSKHKKRMAIKMETTRWLAAKRKDENRDAIKRRIEKKAKKKEMIKMYRAQGHQLRLLQQVEVNAIRRKLGIRRRKKPKTLEAQAES